MLYARCERRSANLCIVLGVSVIIGLGVMLDMASSVLFERETDPLAFALVSCIPGGGAYVRSEATPGTTVADLLGNRARLQTVGRSFERVFGNCLIRSSVNNVIRVWRDELAVRAWEGDPLNRSAVIACDSSKFSSRRCKLLLRYHTPSLNLTDYSEQR